MNVKNSYTDLLAFIGDSPSLSGLELYKEFRKFHPDIRTHYELLKRYIEDKYNLMFYEVQMKGTSEVSELCFGYFQALAEMVSLIDACEYNMRRSVKMKKGS